MEYWNNGQIKKIGDVLLERDGRRPTKKRSEHLRDQE